MYAFSNHPSPRPGFTLVAEQETKTAGTVVVVISDYPASLTALWRAAGEAAQHSAHLHVVDVGPPPGVEEEVLASEAARDRQQAIARAILRNPNVTISQIDLVGRQDLIECCRSVGASLLVVDLGYFKEATRPGGPLESLGDESELSCDLLIVHESTGPPT